MRRVMVALTLVLGGSLCANATARDMHVLPPHAVSAVRKLVDLPTPLVGADGVPLVLSASIERDRVSLWAWDADKTVYVSVTLLHPDDAPADALRAGPVAVALSPGPAPDSLVKQLTQRLEASTATLPWVVVEVAPTTVARPSPAPRLELSRVDRHIQDGETVLARQALARFEVPSDVMEAAGLALRWRRAGEPARAVAITAGLEAEQPPYVVLALRHARGLPVEDAAALGSVPEEGACRAIRLAVLLRTDRLYAAAARVAETVRLRDEQCIEAYHEQVVALEMDGRRQEAERALAAGLERFASDPLVLAADSFLRLRRGDFAGAWTLKVRMETREMLSRSLMTLLGELGDWLSSQARRTVLWVRTMAAVGLHLEAAGGEESQRWCPSDDMLPCLDYVAGGHFQMGAQAKDPSAPGYDVAASPDEGPVRSITISSMHAMPLEVDVRAYTLCVRAGACRAEDVLAGGGYFNYGQPMRLDHPLNGVSWVGAQRYCEWMGGRLPTEAEWEYLARLDTGRRFPWGDTVPDCEVTGSRGAPQGCPRDGTRAPGLRVAQSAAGLTAMGGGVWEWVADWYGPYAPGAHSGPTGPEAGEARVQRGGAWTTDDPLERRASYRASMLPDSQMSDVGFRCVRTLR